MKQLNAKYVSASEAGDYFQVLFEEERDSLKNYFLIQRGFEFEDITPDPCYIESDDLTLCGHLKIKKVELSRNRFYLLLGDKNQNALEIKFETSGGNYQEVKRVLAIILSGYNYTEFK